LQRVLYLRPPATLYRAHCCPSRSEHKFLI
jgi:hypothetical protein